jgi:hypothetical protein
VTLEIYTNEDRQAQRDALGRISDALRGDGTAETTWTGVIPGVNDVLWIFTSDILPGGATGIRTPDLLHAIHARPVARHRPRSPGVDLTCGDNRPVSRIGA